MDFEGRIYWEDSLRPGDVVDATWSSCYSVYSGRCEVVRVNRASVRVRLLESVMTHRGVVGYPAGHELVIPRFHSRTWGYSNHLDRVPAEVVA